MEGVLQHTEAASDHMITVDDEDVPQLEPQGEYTERVTAACATYLRRRVKRGRKIEHLVCSETDEEPVYTDQSEKVWAFEEGTYGKLFADVALGNVEDVFELFLRQEERNDDSLLTDMELRDRDLKVAALIEDYKKAAREMNFNFELSDFQLQALTLQAQGKDVCVISPTSKSHNCFISAFE